MYCLLVYLSPGCNSIQLQQLRSAALLLYSRYFTHSTLVNLSVRMLSETKPLTALTNTMKGIASRKRAGVLGQGKRPALAHLAAQSRSELHQFQDIKLQDGSTGFAHSASTVDSCIKPENWELIAPILVPSDALSVSNLGRVLELCIVVSTTTAFACCEAPTRDQAT